VRALDQLPNLFMVCIIRCFIHLPRLFIFLA
jgi:hypothetical protein